MKTYSNLIFNVRPLGHIDCLGEHFEAVIYGYKNNEGIDYLGRDL